MHRLQTNGFPLCLATHVYTRRLYELISEATGQMVELLCIYAYMYVIGLIIYATSQLSLSLYMYIHIYIYTYYIYICVCVFLLASDCEC
jgi:hypothetical protein